MKKKNGFTLIELLAVIIILGILMIIAIPSVTRYISDSRKSAYVSTAKQVVNAAKNLINSGKLDMYATDTTYYLPSSCFKVENGDKAKSPYGDFVEEKTYVVVTFDGKGYNYFWVSLDSSNIGVKDVTGIDKLSEDNIENDISYDYIKTNITKNGTTKTMVLNNCTDFIDGMPPVTETIKEASSSSLYNIPGTDIYIFIGSNPSNYIKFNCDSSNNCEIWRIIGIYGNMLKIQSPTFLPSQRYNNSSDGNEWENSKLQTMLANDYYETLNEKTKNMIADGTWYVGGASLTATASEAFLDAKTKTWNGKVALLSSYEFLYASDGENCYNNSGDYNGYHNTNCGTSSHDWLNPNNSASYTLSFSKGTSDKILGIVSDGRLATYNVSIPYPLILPTVYLKSSISISGGTGTSADPYVLE